MNFDFEPEQRDLASSFDRAVASTTSTSALRSLWDSDTGRSAQLWRAVSDLGLPAICVSEELGGFGGSLLDLVLVLERVGRIAVPDALLEALVTGPIALASGTREQQERWFPSIATGELRVTAALRGTESVPDAHVSDLIVVRDGSGLAVAETAACTLTALTSMDPSRRQFAVEIPDGVAEPLSGDGLASALAHEAVGSAAVLVGLARRLLHDTVEYVQVREQFGRTIGSFQAVKHQLADATARVTLAGFQVHAAAAKVAAGTPDATVAAWSARLVAIDAEFEANRTSLQLHGGIGFTWEHDLQVWLKKGKVLEQAHGGRGELADEIGAAMLARL